MQDLRLLPAEYDVAGCINVTWQRFIEGAGKSLIAGESTTCATVNMALMAKWQQLQRLALLESGGPGVHRGEVPVLYSGSYLSV